MIPGIVAGGGAYADPPLDADTIALLHFNGADGSVVMDDVAGNAWTPSNNAQLDTAVKMFGASSLLLDGTADYVTIDSPGITLGTGLFTIECFIRWPSMSGNNFVFSFGGGWGVYTFGNQWAVFDGVATNPIGPVSTAATNVWYHVALVFDGTNLSLYVAGVRLGQAAHSTNHSTSFMRIGAQPGGGGDSHANIDEFRVSDIARYSGASFTPPAAPLT